MNQRIPKIAHLLRRWCAEQSGRTCEAMFTKFMEDVLTKTEAKRFFEVYANEPILRFYSSRMCTITAHQDHFNDTAVAEIAASINLSEKIDSRYGKLKSAGSSKQDKTSMSDLVYNETTGDFEHNPSLPSRKEAAFKSLATFSDEELYAELQRRDDERKKQERIQKNKALITEFMETFSLTETDILEVLGVC